MNKEKILYKNYLELDDKIKKIYSFEDYKKIENIRSVEKMKKEIRKMEKYTGEKNFIFNFLFFYKIVFNTENLFLQIASEISKEDFKDFYEKYKDYDEFEFLIIEKKL